ncbi:uncharacterized protein LOC111808272 isoform X1 [Cucurbita pepo subsp. pepo]|uniref:uncharacterized protein LOC111808272 isoform X1 n=2 Tax=Cucurbita pepo subsp. pepo TaxID=3664 RepID=UPI000C9D9BF7|nr:uncharacterized protein LOC111808272 isoform X1 [Cucurbita pepo subsp. pepo]
MTFAELFTRVGSIIGSLVFVWALFQQYFPVELRACFEKYSHRFVSFFYPFVQITFNEFTGEGFTRSEAYIAIQNYLSRNSSSQAKRLKADSMKNNQSLVLTMDDHEEIAEQYEGVKLWWSSGRNISKSQTISFHPATEDKRFFMLTFHRRHRDFIIGQYLNHVLKEGKAIKVKNRQRKLFTNQDAQWSHVVFEHPATFRTLAMKPEKKKEIMDDLIAFSQAEEFYKEIGRAWKRGYLLYGPPGTGKSTMIAAMANLLGYDIYDLELTSVRNNIELRRLLTEISSKAVVSMQSTRRASLMAVSSFPVLSSLGARSNISVLDRDCSLFSLNIPLVNICSRPSTHLSSSTIVCSYKSENSVSERRKKLLEQYGLDPDEFLSEPSANRAREMRKSGKDKQISGQDPKFHRKTHKLLKVLGGSARRMKLLSPIGLDVRPMMEVVKGAAFDILQAAGGCPASLRPGRWLDLYSGTGSVGIEAMSRGCSEVHFVEMDPWVVSDVLRPNLESTGFFDDSVIHTIPVENFIERAEQLIGNDRPFDYISVTPPYIQVDYGVVMEQLSKSALVGEDTFIVVEYPLKTDMLDSCGCLIQITKRRFGRTVLAIYGPKWAEKEKRKK